MSDFLLVVTPFPVAEELEKDRISIHYGIDIDTLSPQLSLLHTRWMLEKMYNHDGWNNLSRVLVVVKRSIHAIPMVIALSTMMAQMNIVPEFWLDEYEGGMYFGLGEYATLGNELARQAEEKMRERILKNGS